MEVYDKYNKHIASVLIEFWSQEHKAINFVTPAHLRKPSNHLRKPLLQKPGSVRVAEDNPS